MYNNFSVLMSVYKKENPRYLDKSISSIVNQTMKTNDFVIVCDGQLTNDLYDVIKKYQNLETNINVLQLEKNSGLGIALNEGLNVCKNEIVARMDSDDISIVNRFEKQFPLFNLNESLAIVGSDIVEFSDESDLKVYKEVPHNNADIISYSKKRNPFNHMSVMFKKSAVLDAGGYLDMPFAEDYYLWVRMLAKGYDAFNLDIPLVEARTGDSMIQRRGGLHYAKCIYRLRYTLWKMGYVSFVNFISTCIPHVVVALLPTFLRRKIYLGVLRGKHEE